MTAYRTLYHEHYDYLSEPLTVADFEGLGLHEKTLRRLRYLLEARRLGTMSPRERAELDSYREAAFYIRMGKQP
ncbi:MAG: hypothetical protein ACLFTK_13090 [Anaerolineales bacterium]